MMRVLFFAHLADVTGCSATELPVTKAINPEQLWSILTQTFPGLQSHHANLRLARNWEYARADTLFDEHDEVALIPPVSGG
jgi:molybdopterin converting factor subunit 1